MSNNNEKAEVLETVHTEHVVVKKEKKIADRDTASNESVNGAGDTDTEKANSFQKPFVKSEAEKRLVKKIQFTLMPFVIWILILQVLYIFTKLKHYVNICNIYAYILHKLLEIN